MPSRFGKTSLPCRAIRRQSETVLGISSYRLATALTVAPSIKVSATIRAFRSDGQSRLPSKRRGTIARNSLVAPIEKLPTNQKSLSIADQPLARKCGGKPTLTKGLRLSTIAVLQNIAPTMIFLVAVFVFAGPFGQARMIAFPMIWTALIIYSASMFRQMRSVI